MPFDHIENVNILIVDDLKQNLMSLENLLHQPDYHIISATSGKQALKHLMNTEFALAILDIQMPEMDGFELASLMKANEKTKDIPIICVSAFHTDEKDIAMVYEIGAMDYLNKPINSKLLQSKVALYVNLYKKTESIKRQLYTDDKIKIANKANAFKANDSLIKELIPEYKKLLIKYIGAVRLKKITPSDHVKVLAKQISDSQLKAKQIINLHVQVLEEITKPLFPSEANANAFALDARLVLLELMGTICDLRL